MKRISTLKFGIVTVLIIALISISGCYMTGEPEEGAGFDWTWIVLLVLLIGMMYFLMIRPQRKRQKEHQQLMDELKRGDKVITAGGIYGVIESISEDSAVLKVESGATMRVARSSVAGKREI
jgi:preprotein translocase subunit YajC